MIKLKNILSEIKWEGKPVELGKVYSNPFATAFKPQEESKTVTDYRNNLDKVSK